MTRIADDTVIGRASFEKEYSIGFESCGACKMETPAPSQAVLDRLCAINHLGTVWPHQHWEVPGWNQIASYGWICDRCSRAVFGLLGVFSSVSGSAVAPETVALEETVRSALALADEAVKSEFPPPPEKVARADYKWTHHTTSSRYLTIDDYRVGMLRERVRAIRDVLLGHPPARE